jgi:radical SAM protein with 4Fe4S-binding SPASM domain
MNFFPVFLRLMPLLIILIKKRRLTLKKVYTLFLNFLYGYILRSNNRGAYPSIMMIEPTNICNLKCSFCALQMEGGVSKEEKRKSIDIDLYKKVIDEVKDHLIFLFLYYGGEPFLHKNIFELVKYASSKNVSVIIATNGAFTHIENFGEKISEADLDVMIVSISGTTQDIYGKYHKGGKIEDVAQNVRSVTRLKNWRKPRLILRFIATSENKEDAKNLSTFSSSLNADTCEVRHVDGQPVLADELEKHSDPTRSRQCFWLWGALVMKSSGSVIPCCYDYYGVPEIGNLQEDKLSAVWDSKKIRDFREKYIKSPENLDCCTQCNSNTGFQDDASKGKSSILIRKERIKNLNEA